MVFESTDLAFPGFRTYQSAMMVFPARLTFPEIRTDRSLVISLLCRFGIPNTSRSSQLHDPFRSRVGVHSYRIAGYSPLLCGEASRTAENSCRYSLKLDDRLRRKADRGWRSENWGSSNRNVRILRKDGIGNSVCLDNKVRYVLPGYRAGTSRRPDQDIPEPYDPICCTADMVTSDSGQCSDPHYI